MFQCIYCPSATPPKKREHVISRLLGDYEQNWTLDCVCDECNEYFANTLELPLGRDSREAFLRLELGLKPQAGASQLLHRRVKTSLQDPGQFDGIRVLMRPSSDGTYIEPVPVPQIGLRVQGEEWTFLTERELTFENLRRFQSVPFEVKIVGVGPDCDRLRERLAAHGITFEESHRILGHPITQQPSLSVLFEIENDVTIVRAACKTGFNYAARMLGADTVRQPRFDAARRFVRYGEAPVQVASAQQRSILVGPEAAATRIHACGLGWDNGYLVVVVSLFNELTYGMRLCEARPDEFLRIQHFFDPWKRTIIEAPTAGSAEE